MRLLLSSMVFLALSGAAWAGPPYTPLPLKPAELVTPSPELIKDASAFLEAIKGGNTETIALGIAPKVTTVDGALNLDIPRRKETVGPFDTVEELLAELGWATGGDIQEPADGSSQVPFQIEAERQYIVSALTDPTTTWGTDPMIKGAICTYGYRSFDIKKLKALSEMTGVSSSSFVYVDAPHPLLAKPEKGAETIGTLETDRLYALDYDTDAPGRWMAIYLPDGSSGFVNFDQVELQKPYAAGICFAQNKDKRWVMVAQTSTSL